MVSSTVAVDQFKYFLISLRPYQWSKNLLVFAALIFSGHLFEKSYLENSFLIFIVFCMVSGSIYIFNDIKDRKEDVLHPEKKNRPIASGKLVLPIAWSGAFITITLSIILALLINQNVLYIIGFYLILTIFYTLKLKHVVILDILIVAIGFVLRAVAGAVAIQVYISPWLLVCAFFLALFLVIGKRRNELIVLKDDAINHRKILEEYNPKLLDQMISVVTATTIVSYALYTLDSHTVERFHTTNLIFTIPFVILGVFRYFYLIYKKDMGGRPEKILINDRGILLTVLVWIIVVGIIIY